MALGEVRREDAPPAASSEKRPCIVDRQGDEPEGALRRPVERRGSEDQPGRDDRGRSETHDSAADVVVVGRKGVQHDVQHPDRKIGAAEEERVVAESAGRSQTDDEHRRHGPEHGQPRRSLVRINRVGEPGVGGPGPPERRQNKHPSREPGPRRVGRHEARYLRQAEHEDEIEEELERRHPLLGLDVVLQLVPRRDLHHGASGAPRTKSATVSMWGVCGNMSTGRARSSR